LPVCLCGKPARWTVRDRDTGDVEGWCGFFSKDGHRYSAFCTCSDCCDTRRLAVLVPVRPSRDVT
jgi:hypothetical protein